MNRPPPFGMGVRPPGATPYDSSDSGSSSAGPATISAPPSGHVDCTRHYRDLFTHQYDPMTNQLDSGLRYLKRMASYLEKFVEIHASDADNLLKQVKSVKEKFDKLKDDAAIYVTGYLAIEEVIMQAENAQKALLNNAKENLVKPIQAYYKTSQAKRRKTDDEVAKMKNQLASTTSDINKERADCLKSHGELKKAVEERDQSQAKGPEVYAKKELAWKKQKETVVKKFQQFEQHLQKAREMQTNYHSVFIPKSLEEIESMERDRLKYFHECMEKFQAMFNDYTTTITHSRDLLAKLLPTLHTGKALNSMFDKWQSQYGAPPAVQVIPYDLPCSSQEVASDILQGSGGMGGGYIGGGAPTSPMSGNSMRFNAPPMSPVNDDSDSASPSAYSSAPPRAPPPAPSGGARFGLPPPPGPSGASSGGPPPPPMGFGMINKRGSDIGAGLRGPPPPPPGSQSVRAPPPRPAAPSIGGANDYSSGPPPPPMGGMGMGMAMGGGPPPPPPMAVSAAPAPPPPAPSFVPAAPAAPSPPPPGPSMSFAPTKKPAASGGNDRGALLSSIQAGTRLKKVQTVVKGQEVGGAVVEKKGGGGGGGSSAPAPKPRKVSSQDDWDGDSADSSAGGGVANRAQFASQLASMFGGGGGAAPAKPAQAATNRFQAPKPVAAAAPAPAPAPAQRWGAPAAAAPPPAPEPEPEPAPSLDYLYNAVALFDFQLPNDPSNEIQYVSFRAGDIIRVSQESEEWWFGEVNGQSGFFPFNYVQRQ